MLYDVTPRITPRLAVWPGDTPPRREVLLDLARGDSVTLSTLQATVHLGAHADAPSHTAPDGAPIHAVQLEPYLGPCQVIRIAAPPGGMLTPADLHVRVRAPRVLFATGTFPDPEAFTTDFAALTPALIATLAESDVRLVGVDTPSVDPFASRDLPAHAACRRHGMAILEGLALEGVPDGLYELIALPLPLEGFDASPVRAVLRVPESLRRPGAGGRRSPR